MPTVGPKRTVYNFQSTIKADMTLFVRDFLQKRELSFTSQFSATISATQKLFTHETGKQETKNNKLIKWILW